MLQIPLHYIRAVRSMGCYERVIDGIAASGGMAIPLAGFKYTVLGRLRKMEMLSGWAQLRPEIMSITDAQVSALEVNRLLAEAPPGSSFAEALEAKKVANTAWVREIDEDPTSLLADGVQYVSIKDHAAPANISRLQMVVRSGPGGSFSIMALETANKVYMRGVALKPMAWHPIPYEAMVTVGPATPDFYAYLMHSMFHSAYSHAKLPAINAAVKPVWLVEFRPYGLAAGIRQTALRQAREEHARLAKAQKHSEDHKSTKRKAVDSALAAVSASTRANIHDEMKCSICLEMLFMACAIDCGHVFCRGCIDGWFARGSINARKCPECRAPSKNPPTPQPRIDSMVNCLVPTLTESERKSREAHIKLLDDTVVVSDDDDDKDSVRGVAQDVNPFRVIEQQRVQIEAAAAAAAAAAVPAAAAPAAVQTHTAYVVTIGAPVCHGCKDALEPGTVAVTRLDGLALRQYHPCCLPTCLDVDVIQLADGITRGRITGLLLGRIPRYLYSIARVIPEVHVDCAKCGTGVEAGSMYIHCNASGRRVHVRCHDYFDHGAPIHLSRFNIDPSVRGSRFHMHTVIAITRS